MNITKTLAISLNLAQKRNEFSVQNNVRKVSQCIEASSYWTLQTPYRQQTKLHNFTCPLYGLGEHSTRIFFFFFQTQIRSFRFQPRTFSPKFYKFNEIE